MLPAETRRGNSTISWAADVPSGVNYRSRRCVRRLPRYRLDSPLATVSFLHSTQGMMITPKLDGLPPGKHGFHIHDKGDCGPAMNQGKPAAGFAAGGHYDPAHAKKHLGPLSAAGHRGDLPMLVVDSRGDATQAVTAAHLTVEQIRARSIMIHAGGDDYSDTPAPLGCGGAAMACRVVH